MKLTTVLVVLFFLWVFGLLSLALSIACVVLIVYCLGLVVVGAETVVSALAWVMHYITKGLIKCSKKY